MVASSVPPGEMGVLGSSNSVLWMSVAELMSIKSACLSGHEAIRYDPVMQITRVLLISRLVVISTVTVGITRKNKEDILANEVQLARRKRLALAALWEGNDPLADKRWGCGRRRYIKCDQTCEA